MGAGKTVVGLRLAELMAVEFVDLDRAVESEANLPIAEIFVERGEEGFRRLESAALRSLADREDDLVVATGGGTATRLENVELMRSTGTSVWLDSPFEEILNRLDTALRRERPLFESPTQARRLYKDRTDAYSHADLRIDIAADEQPEETAQRILRILSKAEPAERPLTKRR